MKGMKLPVSFRISEMWVIFHLDELVAFGEIPSPLSTYNLDCNAGSRGRLALEVVGTAAGIVDGVPVLDSLEGKFASRGVGFSLGFR